MCDQEGVAQRCWSRTLKQTATVEVAVKKWRWSIWLLTAHLKMRRRKNPHRREAVLHYLACLLRSIKGKLSFQECNHSDFWSFYFISKNNFSKSQFDLCFCVCFQSAESPQTSLSFESNSQHATSGHQLHSPTSPLNSGLPPLLPHAHRAVRYTNTHIKLLI